MKIQRLKLKIQSKFKVINFKVLILTFLTLSLFYSLNFKIENLYAKEDKTVTAISKKILGALDADALSAPFEQLKEHYFKSNDYDGMVAVLDTLGSKKSALLPFTGYYSALARYQQLKHLEENQEWDEYFSNGNSYRDGVSEGIKSALEAPSAPGRLKLMSKLLSWRFHQDQQDNLAGSSLDGLMAETAEYLKSGSDLAPVKEVADALSVYKEQAKARLVYRGYADKLISTSKDESQLLGAAEGFYKEGNLELSESLYDVYLDRAEGAGNKEKGLKELKKLIRSFSYKDGALTDALYTGKLFSRLEKVGGAAAFDEELNYLRAFNLEKSKDFPAAQAKYAAFAGLYPQSAKFDEAQFKAGLFAAYVMRDLDGAKERFAQLSGKKSPSPQSVSALYHLGLLAQWQGDGAKAKEFYQNAIDVSKGGFQDTVALAKERLKELADSGQMENNLKAFMDAALKESPLSDGQRVELSISPYVGPVQVEVDIQSQAYTAPSGCMQVELQYLWSGHLGDNTNPGSVAQFPTRYAFPGSKETFLVVLSPTGIVDYKLDVADIR
jgi:TolA-binding protein